MKEQRGMTNKLSDSRHVRGGVQLARDVALTVGLSILLAFAANSLRNQPLPWVQPTPYDILVPCPEVTGDATEIAANSPLLSASSTLLIDVRSPEEFSQWHAPKARNRPFDWLGPPVDAEVTQIAKELAMTGMQHVVVYGDGEDPDSGREWARILSGARLKNISFVHGGAPAIRRLSGDGKVAP